MDEEKKSELKLLTKQIIDLLQPHGSRTRLFALSTATAACFVAMYGGDEDKAIKNVAVFASLTLGLCEELAASADTDAAIQKAIDQAKATTEQPN